MSDTPDVGNPPPNVVVTWKARYDLVDGAQVNWVAHHEGKRIGVGGRWYSSKAEAMGDMSVLLGWGSYVELHGDLRAELRSPWPVMGT